MELSCTSAPARKASTHTDIPRPVGLLPCAWLGTPHGSRTCRSPLGDGTFGGLPKVYGLDESVTADFACDIKSGLAILSRLEPPYVAVDRPAVARRIAANATR